MLVVSIVYSMVRYMDVMKFRFWVSSLLCCYADVITLDGNSLPNILVAHFLHATV